MLTIVATAVTFGTCNKHRRIALSPALPPQKHRLLMRSCCYIAAVVLVWQHLLSWPWRGGGRRQRRRLLLRCSLCSLATHADTTDHPADATQVHSCPPAMPTLLLYYRLLSAAPLSCHHCSLIAHPVSPLPVRRPNCASAVSAATQATSSVLTSCRRKLFGCARRSRLSSAACRGLCLEGSAGNSKALLPCMAVGGCCNCYPSSLQRRSEQLARTPCAQLLLLHGRPSFAYSMLADAVIAPLQHL